MLLRTRVFRVVLLALAAAVPFAASNGAKANDAVWKASRPIRVVVSDFHTQAGDSHLLVRQRAESLAELRADLAVAQANVKYLEWRLHSYRVFRFSDAVQPAIARAEFALHVARRIVDHLNGEIRRVSRSR